MASSDNLMTMEQPWAFRTAFADAWVSDIYTKETDTLTKALQRSFAADGGAFSRAEMVDSLFVKTDMAPIRTPMASGCSENEAAAPVSKLRRTVPPTDGRVAKRKSRASKRATTTFITADAANFRQMVQQVTGLRFAGLNGGTTEASEPLPKAEPHRMINWLQMCGGSPTFDMSAFLLDGSASTLVAQPPTPTTVVTDGNGIEFDSLYSYPTLESWKVM